MVAAVDHVQLRAIAELVEHGLQLAEIRERVARALEEQHRQLDVAQVFGARASGLARRVQREAEEHETAHARERALRRRGRGHAAAERFAAREQRQLRRRLRRGVDAPRARSP